jgi:hypothetical protein
VAAPAGGGSTAQVIAELQLHMLCLGVCSAVMWCSNWSGPPMAVLLNKADSITPEAMEELVAWYKEACR